MTSRINWGFIFLLIVALVAIPTDSIPSFIDRHAAYSSIEKLSPNNESLYSSPADVISTGRDLQHPEPDNASLDLTSSPYLNRTVDTNATTRFGLLSHGGDDPSDNDEYELDCSGAEYFSPSVVVDCSYTDGASRSRWWVNNGKFSVSMPPAGLSYSSEASGRWANNIVNRLPPVTDEYDMGYGVGYKFDWYELDERNNWGRGVMVKFTMFKREGEVRAAKDNAELVEGAVRKGMCGKFVDITFKDGGCYQEGMTPNADH